MKINYYYILAFLSCILFLACSKKYTTKPQLEIQSISTNTLNPGDSIKIIFKLRDREGDVSQSVLYIGRKKRDCSLGGIKSLPYFLTTKDFKGDLTVVYSYNEIRSGCIMPNDTCVLRFAISDNAGNVSDTINTENIFLH